MILRNFRTDMMLGGHMFFRLLIGLMIIALIVLLIIYFSKKIKTANSVQPSSGISPAMETLKMKYASGEITEEEYLKRKDVLSRN